MQNLNSNPNSLLDPNMISELGIENVEFQPKMSGSDASASTTSLESVSESSTAGGSLGFGLSEDRQESSNNEPGENHDLENPYAAEINKNVSNSAKEFVVQTRPTLTGEQEAQNVKELIGQAQSLIKNGGGEMKIQMNPHGLGEVTMKINVENGNVRVEMLAENGETKSLLEKGALELKSSLASHRLNLEEIKVDTSKDMFTDLSDKQKDAERQLAEQFMGEFRRNNQSWREGFADFVGARAYKSQTQDEAENPLLAMNQAQAARNASRRLNLVA
jgi:flagellar hook-length control protein FliK